MPGLSTPEVGLVQAVARPAVMDYVLEKGTEVGAELLRPRRAAGSPRRSEAGATRPSRPLAPHRREAAKQSKQTAVPCGRSLVPRCAEALRSMAAAGSTVALVLDPAASAVAASGAGRRPSRPRCGMCSLGRARRRLDPAELELLTAAGVAPARLGRSVLRTETAGPVAVAVARLALGDW